MLSSDEVRIRVSFSFWSTNVLLNRPYNVKKKNGDPLNGAPRQTWSVMNRTSSANQRLILGSATYFDRLLHVAITSEYVQPCIQSTSHLSGRRFDCKSSAGELRKFP